MLGELRARRDGLRAVALCTEVALQGGEGAPSSPIRVAPEARDGQCLALIAPYLPGPQLQQPVVQRSRPQVWA